MSTFKRFTADDIVNANPTEVTTGLWSGDTGSLSMFYTLASQTASISAKYFWNVYNINPTSSTAEVQFAVAYGHRTGGGSQDLVTYDASPIASQGTYLQYRNMLLDPEDSQFTFQGSWNSDHIYVINVQRNRLKETLDPGNWLLTLSGSNGRMTFIDDSGQTLGADYGRAGAVFNVVSGSLTGVSGSTVAATTSSTKGGFGLVYPALGIIVLNPDAITQTVGLGIGHVSGTAPFAPNTGTLQESYNHVGLFRAIQLGRDFQARSAETVASTHYFVHLRNKDFNYSNNPSFFNATNGVIENTDFIKDPRVYVTTVGLYNDQNEMLAVAKLSSAVQKAFDKEVLLKIRLDW